MSPAALLLLASSLAPGAERAGDVREIVAAIVEAVETSQGQPRTDFLYDLATDEAVMLVFAWKESSFLRDAESPDHKDHGAWQLRFVPRVYAVQPHVAARIWYARALTGKRLWPDDPLEGICGGGPKARAVARERVALARALLAKHPEAR